MSICQFSLGIVLASIFLWVSLMYFRRPKDINEWGIGFGILAGILISAAMFINSCPLRYYSLLETEIVSIVVASTGIVAAYTALLILSVSCLRESRTIIARFIKNVRRKEEEVS